jgi:hypothetical protein
MAAQGLSAASRFDPTGRTAIATGDPGAIAEGAFAGEIVSDDLGQPILPRA